jgi:hypothetical protein
MANEFVIREGFSSEANATITGSLTVTGGITGSLASASYAITASYSINALTASLVSSIPTASFTNFAVSASQATLGSFVPSYATNYTTTQLNPNFITGITGSGYLSPMLYSTVNTGTATANRQLNTVYLTPLYINSNCTVRKIGVLSQRVGANNNIRLGLYTNSNLMLPETNLSDTVITPLDNTARFYEAALATPVNLQAGEIYWIASMLCGGAVVVGGGVGTVANISYRTVDTQLLSLPQGGINKIYNNLLGSTAPINQNAIKHISYYALTVASTASLQASLPQTPGSYTIYSYGARINNTTLLTFYSNTFIPPAIYVTY